MDILFKKLQTDDVLYLLYVSLLYSDFWMAYWLTGESCRVTLR
jgi:hypothetical protein